jgi:DNA-directed RNA polymerase specialized sigma24 family protein
MSSDGSVTHWLGQLKAGQKAAAQPLWEAYFQKLVRLARQKLGGAQRRVADEEDVALSAFDSFCRGAAQGRFPQLADRHDLWCLLVVITVRKALDLRNRERALKRGGAGRGEAALLEPPQTDTAVVDLEQVVGTEPTPAFAAEFAEQFQVRLRLLPDEQLRQIALRKLEGYTNAEIGEQLGCAVATVERRLGLIRGAWEKEVSQ